MPAKANRPTTESELVDELVRRQRTPNPVADAVRAWTDNGGRPGLHATRQQIVRREMPLLADALGRLTQRKQH